MNVDEELVRRRIQQKLDGRGCLYGYRAMWHAESLFQGALLSVV